MNKILLTTLLTGIGTAITGSAIADTNPESHIDSTITLEPTQLNWSNMEYSNNLQIPIMQYDLSNNLTVGEGIGDFLEDIGLNNENILKFISKMGISNNDYHLTMRKKNVNGYKINFMELNKDISKTTDDNKKLSIRYGSKNDQTRFETEYQFDF
ncbi:hypothetical protein ACFL1H_05890 [Nanoarchaeota archaeon]